jgi:hypothetical protein
MRANSNFSSRLNLEIINNSLHIINLDTSSIQARSRCKVTLIILFAKLPDMANVANQNKLKALSFVRRQEDIEAAAQKDEHEQQYERGNARGALAAGLAAGEASNNARNLQRIGADSGYDEPAASGTQMMANTVLTVLQPAGGAIAHALLTG